MSDALISGLAQGGASSLLLGIVLMVLAPQVIKAFRENVKVFQEEMERERSAHRTETREMSQSLHALSIESAQQTAELRQQTEVLGMLLRRDHAA